MPRTQTAIAETLRDSKILVVDDIEVNCRVLRHIFTMHGMPNVREAKGGQEALQQIATWQPDVVLLDLMMPQMDGEEVCRQIDVRNMRHPPLIIVQTAMMEPEYKRRLFSLGVTDYVIKPVDEMELIARCMSHIERRALAINLQDYRQQTQYTLHMAAEMQTRTMPSPVQLEKAGACYGMHIAGHYRPSEQLGGDCWNLVPLDDHRFAVYLSDFSGHGLVASLNTFRLQTMLSETSMDLGNAAVALSRLNEGLHRLLRPGEFATMLYCVFDTAAGTLSIANAGALPPLLLMPDGAMCSPAITGPPLGSLPWTPYRSINLPFTPGGMLLLMSDGLLECPGMEDGTLDLSEFCTLANRVRAGEMDVTALLQHIVLSGRLHPSRTGLADDETAVLVFYG